MTRVFTYLPMIGMLLVLFFMEESVLRWVLLVLSIILIVFAKFVRTKQDQDEVEYDDRVNANITKWSLRLMFVFNAVLMLLLLIDSNEILDLSMNFVLIYLALTLFIPFYIAPLIIKRF